MSNIGNVTFGDTIYLYEETDASSVAIGIDSDDQVFKISTSLSVAGDTLPSTNPNFLIDTAANGHVTVTPNGTGHLVLTNGIFDLPYSLGLLSNVTIGGFPFLRTGNSGLPSSTFLGVNAGNNTVTGAVNVGIGTNSSTALTTGFNNTAIGSQSLQNVTSGRDNIAVGKGAGIGITTNNFNIMIGHLSNGGDSHTIRIGSNGDHQSCFVAGIEDVNVGSTAKVVTINADQLGSATITAGTGIAVTPGANTITIASTAGGFAWNVITGATQTLAVQNGYISNRAGLVTYTLPATAAVGDMIRVTLINAAGSWTIAQNAGQTIKISGGDTTVGVGGSLSSTANGDTIELLCTVANTNFIVLSVVGNLTVV